MAETARRERSQYAPRNKRDSKTVHGIRYRMRLFSRVAGGKLVPTPCWIEATRFTSDDPRRLPATREEAEDWLRLPAFAKIHPEYVGCGVKMRGGEPYFVKGSST